MVGWLWLFIDVGMVAILGITIAYGGMVWRNRSTPLDAKSVLI
jgi:hypothetical protein